MKTNDSCLVIKGNQFSIWFSAYHMSFEIVRKNTKREETLQNLFSSVLFDLENFLFKNTNFKLRSAKLDFNDLKSEFRKSEKDNFTSMEKILEGFSFFVSYLNFKSKLPQADLIPVQVWLFNDNKFQRKDYQLTYLEEDTLFIDEYQQVLNGWSGVDVRKIMNLFID